MLHQAYLTDWHQIFLVAAGFLTATLVVWIQFWVRSLYTEQPPNDKRRFADRSFSVHTAILWLYVGVLFALLAFGLTGLDWLLAGKALQCSLAACLIGRMQMLTAGFLMGAFDITLIAVIQQIFNSCETLKGEGESEPIYYTNRNRKGLRRALYVALALVSISCLIPAIMAPNYWQPSWWLWLALFCFLIPGFVLYGTIKYISCQRRRQDP